MTGLPDGSPSPSKRPYAIHLDPVLVDQNPGYEQLAAEIEWLRNELSRRDAVLDWLTENTPRVLELCPFKVER